MDDIPRTFWYRAFEILPGALSWTIIFMPFVISIWLPRAIAIFIIIYVLLWFLRSIKLGIFLIYAYFTNKRLEEQNWKHILDFFSDFPPKPQTNFENKTADKIKTLRKNKFFKKRTDIYHVVIIATYKEEKEILESTIKAISKADYPLDKIFIVLATEERDRERAQANAEYLSAKFQNTFGRFFHVMHPKNLPDEIIGKGSNITYAGKQIANILKEQNFDPSNILVTTLDADNQPHKVYFSSLTYHYLAEKNRKKCCYQPLPFFYNNIWDVPLWNRLVSLATTFWHLSQSAQIYTLMNFSAHAQSLDALLETNFWSKHTIDEDGHQFWRSYFTFKGNYEVIPIFIPVYQDAVQNRTYFSSIKGQYVQLRRWAWGVTDIPYVLIKWWKNRKRLPFWKSLKLILQLFDAHIMRATAPIVIGFSSYMPGIINKNFSTSVFAYNFGQALSLFFTISLIPILISLWISLLTLPPHPKGIQWKLLSGLQWIFLPPITIFFGAIPSLDAQTRLMINKRLEFVVTEKIKKIN